jgi:EAL domain-containing protein (putative c-di-GMP-specific phosphodiesterase class I)
MVPPDEFIPIAEESGLIVPIGDWVLREACRQSNRWQADFDVPVVWVNISAVQLGQKNFPERVAAILAEAGTPAHRIGIEITESALMADVAVATCALEGLKALGVHLAVDDFGTGYSSLAYLKRFPVDIVKIDRSFVAGLGSDADDTEIVAAVVKLTHALRRRVVAEGVETAAQLAELRALGCDVAQGYYFGRPAAAGTGEALSQLAS